MFNAQWKIHLQVPLERLSCVCWMGAILIKFIDLQVDIEFDLPEVVNMPSLESILNEV